MTVSLSDAEQIFDRMGHYPNYKIYIAEIGNRIVGTFALLIMDNLGHMGASSAIIEAVAVDPVYQGQGIRAIMMRYAIQLSADNKCYKAVFSSNLKRERAHSFYESLAFERQGYSFRINPQNCDYK